MRHVPPGARILDLGCGTGEDALWLAGQGYAVDAIDESAKMIEAAQAKAERQGGNVRFSCRKIESVGQEGETFDAVISNFGALNCVPLATWARILPRLAVGGRAFLVLMTKTPFPEWLRRGFQSGTLRRGGEVRVGTAMVRVHYHPARVVREAIADAFRVRVEALGCLVPGPGYQGFAERHPLALGLLAMGEAALRRVPFFRHHGDHTLYELTRT